MSALPSTSTVDPYKELPPIKNVRLKLTSGQPFVPQYVQSTLEKSTNLDSKAVYNSRVRDRRIVLENPARASRAKQERDEKNVRRAKEKLKKKMGVIGRKEANVRGVWKMRKEHAKYNLFLPLHHLWLGYMSELLGLNPVPPNLSSMTSHNMPGSAGMHAKLVKADFHGSILTVKQSKNSCLVGHTGIVIHETENAFKIVTENDQLKLIPKENSIFTFRIPLYDIRSETGAGSAAIQLQAHTMPAGTDSMASIEEHMPQIEFELYGNQFRFRAADRSSRKFKHKETIEL